MYLCRKIYCRVRKKTLVDLRQQRDRLASDALNIPSDSSSRGLRRFAQVINAYNNEAVKRGVSQERFNGLYIRTDLKKGRNVVSNKPVSSLRVALSNG